MVMQRVTFRLTEIRCLEQSEGSTGSEPYLWTSFFAFGAAPLPFQTGNMAVHTPSYDAFRTEFPDGIKAGQATVTPSFVSIANFDMDLDVAFPPKMIGCIAVLMEQDDTPQSSIVLGRIAYAKEIDAQLNLLAHKRIQMQDFSPITPAEINAIRSGVESKVRTAVGSNQSVWDFFRNQDDTIGFAYKVFQFPPPANDPASAIKFQYFDFPEITNNAGDRFLLSGGLSLGPVPAEPVILCGAQREAVKAKADQLEGLQLRKRMLQEKLHTATPQQKAAIIDQIEATSALIATAEAELVTLQAALDACLPDMGGNTGGPAGGGVLEPPVVADHG